MNQQVTICNFKIPLEHLPLYKEISREFEMTVRDAVRPSDEKEPEEKVFNSETRRAMMAMLNKF